MIWGLTHGNHFICIKCNAEMSFFTQNATVLLKCSKCKYQIEVKKSKDPIIY